MQTQLTPLKLSNRICPLPIAFVGLVVAVVCLTTLANARLANAQGTATASAFGTRNLGGSSIPSTGGGQIGTGQLGGTSGGATLGGGLGGGQGGTSQATGQRQTQAGRFVGADLTDSRAVGNVMAGNAQQSQQNNMFQNLFQQMNRNQNRNQNQANSTQSKLRIPLKLGFKAVPTNAPRFTAQFEKRIVKLPGLSTLGPITASLEGTTVVLRGKVASEADRQLAEEVAMLEPEVSEVQNELEVSEGPPTVEVLPVPRPAKPAAQ